MDFKEFKKKIEKIDYLTVKEGDFDDVLVKSDLDMPSGSTALVACIDSAGEVDFGWYGVIKAAHMQKVINLVEDFAETPYEERMNKHYYLLVGGNRVKNFECNIERVAEADPEYNLEITFSNNHAIRVAYFEKKFAESIFKRAGVKFEWEEV
ncbi:hypothetical protein [Enterococcus phage IMEEF1]|uniref:Uncharacterized protein n=1 Tax=Enterococcus phage IMEEF1 TaxID=1351735 RepID=S5M8P3_9CAUD|nr:hypothetical protein FDH83_gp43 [Enterococcus phage IMEEF1]AGR49026.1 hypothetical protein [Enterococcus phage IMEEF1]